MTSAKTKTKFMKHPREDFIESGADAQKTQLP